MAWFKRDKTAAKGKTGRIARGVGEATGLSVAYRVATSSVNEVRGSVGRSGRLFRIFHRRPDEGVAISDPDAEPSLKFIAAAEANGLDEAAIANAITNTHRQFIVYLILTLATIVAGILSYSWDPPQSGLSLMTVFGRFAVLPLALALLTRSGYLNWVFRNRHLAGLDVYLRSGDLMSKPPAT